MTSTEAKMATDGGRAEHTINGTRHYVSGLATADDAVVVDAISSWKHSVNISNCRGGLVLFAPPSDIWKRLAAVDTTSTSASTSTPTTTESSQIILPPSTAMALRPHVRRIAEAGSPEPSIAECRSSPTRVSVSSCESLTIVMFRGTRSLSLDTCTNVHVHFVPQGDEEEYIDAIEAHRCDDLRITLPAANLQRSDFVLRHGACTELKIISYSAFAAGEGSVGEVGDKTGASAEEGLENPEHEGNNVALDETHTLIPTTFETVFNKELSATTKPSHSW